MSVVEAVFDVAADADSTIGDAYLAFCAKAKVRLHPEFEESVKDCPKRYTAATAETLRGTMNVENDDEAIRRLEVELHMRKESRAKAGPPTVRRRVAAHGG
jgi:hypothetical protein